LRISCIQLVLFYCFGFARRSPQAEPMTFPDFIADDPESCLLA
jgi:hypothetical protein